MLTLRYRPSNRLLVWNRRVWLFGAIWLAASRGGASASGADEGAAFQVRARDAESIARSLAAPPPPTGKHWVFFTDKQIFDSAACARELRRLASSIEPHAAARRARSMGRDVVDFHDISVPERYLESVARTGAHVARTSRWLNAVSVEATPAQLEALAGLGFVAKIEPVRGTRKDGKRDGLAPTANRGSSPPPPRIASDRYDYGPSRDQIDQINVTTAHAARLSGAGVIVAMFDTGFQHEHPAFAQILADGRLLAQYDFVKNDGETQNEPGDNPQQHVHGTFTWSTLGGFFEGELVGPAFGASFLLGKTEDLDSETPLEEDNWVAAAEWADAQGADVISTSLSYIDWYVYEDMDGDTAPITRAADIAASRGIVVCVSAGNQGGLPWYYIGAPADADSVIAVGAVDRDNVLAEFSSHGPTADGRIKPEVVALGVDTWCALPIEFGDDFTDVSGTSLSCPLVGGAAALVLEAHPSWSPMKVRDQLLATADNAASPDNDRGWGLIDVWRAIRETGEGWTWSAGPAPLLVASPNPTSAGAWLFAPPVRGSAALEIFDVAGAMVQRLDPAPASGAVFWDGRSRSGDSVTPGIYFARWRAGDSSASTKLIVLD
jgi:serine protease AprX